MPDHSLARDSLPSATLTSNPCAPARDRALVPPPIAVRPSTTSTPSAETNPRGQCSVNLWTSKMRMWRAPSIHYSRLVMWRKRSSVMASNRKAYLRRTRSGNRQPKLRESVAHMWYSVANSQHPLPGLSENPANNRTGRKWAGISPQLLLLLEQSSGGKYFFVSMRGQWIRSRWRNRHHRQRLSNPNPNHI